MKVIGKIPPILLYVLTALSPLTETIYSTALPEIAEHLSVEGGNVQYASTSYYLGFALGILTLGRISDIYGRKPVVMFGILLYIVSTFTLSLSKTIEFFIFTRFIQAYGASVGSVMSQSMARDSYKGWELSYVYASVAMIMSLVPSIGSLIGGYIMYYFNDWHYIFVFLVFMGSIMFFINLLSLPETNPYINEGKNNRFFQVLKVAVRDKILVSKAVMVGLFNGLGFGFYVQAPFIFIERLNIPSSNYSQLFLFLTIANLFGGLLVRLLVKRFVKLQKIKIIGLTINVMAAIMFLTAMLIVDPNSILWSSITIFLGISLHWIGHTMVVPMILKGALEDYQKVNGSAGSIFGSMYYMITAIVSFFIAFLHSETIDNYAMLYCLCISINIFLFVIIGRWIRQNKSEKYKVISD